MYKVPGVYSGIALSTLTLLLTMQTSADGVAEQQVQTLKESFEEININ